MHHVWQTVGNIRNIPQSTGVQLSLQMYSLGIYGIISKYDHNIIVLEDEAYFDHN